MSAKFRFVLISLLMTLMVGASPCQAEIKVLSVKHLVAEEIVSVVRDVLEGQGKVSTWDNRLIVNASPEEIATIEEVLQQIDVPPTMLRISVRQEDSKGKAANRVTLAEKPNTGTVAYPGAHQIGNTVKQTVQTLRVRDGGRGFILMGEMVPYVREMLLLARRYAGYGETVDFQAVNTGFWVRPTLERGFATLEIRPYLEGFQRSSARMMGMPSAVKLQELVSTVRVPLGQWVDLGHHLKQGDEVSQAILTWRTGNLQQERTVWVKVEP
ncbi:MAG: secretin N-terminal domain-containing protein [Syntrophotaleaceae bacterium]